jgi:hypothetical protein
VAKSFIKKYCGKMLFSLVAEADATALPMQLFRKGYENSVTICAKILHR